MLLNPTFDFFHIKFNHSSYSKNYTTYHFFLSWFGLLIKLLFHMKFNHRRHQVATPCRAWEVHARGGGRSLHGECLDLLTYGRRHLDPIGGARPACSPMVAATWIRLEEHGQPGSARRRVQWGLQPLTHVRVLAPVGKCLLPRFSSRCCPSGTKGPSFNPGSENPG